MQVESWDYFRGSDFQEFWFQVHFYMSQEQEYFIGTEAEKKSAVLRIRKPVVNRKIVDLDGVIRLMG